MIDGRARGLFAGRQTRRELVERERIVAELDAVQPRRAPTRQTRRSARSAPPRRSPTRPRAPLRPGRRRPASSDPREIVKVSASRTVAIRVVSFTGATLVPQRARSSGDRALASGARGRRFDSCRAHRACRRSGGACVGRSSHEPLCPSAAPPSRGPSTNGRPSPTGTPTRRRSSGGTACSGSRRRQDCRSRGQAFALRSLNCGARPVVSASSRARRRARCRRSTRATAA